MDGQIKLNYQEFKSALSKANQDSPTDHKLLLQQLNKAEEQLNYYQKRYYEMKLINQAIITSIKRVYSQQVGEELQKMIEHKEGMLQYDFQTPDTDHLTNTFCEMMISYGSKFVTEQSIDKLPIKLNTPKNINFNFGGEIGNLSNNKGISVSPILKKSNIKRTPLDESSMKLDSGDISTRRSGTPIKTHIATQIYCQLCEKVYPPNQFVGHAQRCKYQLEYVQSSEFQESSREKNLNSLQINYDKMMRNLSKIKFQIEEQIRLISYSKEQIDRVNLRKKLQKDLKKVIKVIGQKQQQLKKKKCSSVNNSLLKSINNKKQSKLR